MHRGDTLATIPVALLHKNTLASWGATRTRSVNDLPESTMCRVSEPVRLLAAVRHSTLRHPLAKRVFGRILQLLLIRSIIHDGNISWELAGEPHNVPLLITRTYRPPGYWLQHLFGQTVTRRMTVPIISSASSSRQLLSRHITEVFYDANTISTVQCSSQGVVWCGGEVWCGKVRLRLSTMLQDALPWGAGREEAALYGRAWARGLDVVQHV